MHFEFATIFWGIAGAAADVAASALNIFWPAIAVVSLNWNSITIK